VPFFLKQLGANVVEGPFVRRIGGCMADGHDKHNGDESRWPADLRGCRTFPTSRAA